MGLAFPFLCTPLATDRAPIQKVESSLRGSSSKNVLPQLRILIVNHLMSKDSTIRLASSSLRPAYEVLLSPAIRLRSAWRAFSRRSRMMITSSHSGSDSSSMVTLSFKSRLCRKSSLASTTVLAFELDPAPSAG